MNAHSKKQCFVIMPLKPEFDATYDTIQAAIREVGKDNPEDRLECQRGDKLGIAAGGMILTAVAKAIIDADLVIADVSGNNPNVFYELGIAHCHIRKTILTYQGESSHVPFDIGPYRNIQYQPDRNGLELLFFRLKNEIKEAIHAETIDNPISQVILESQREDLFDQFIAGCRHPLTAIFIITVEAGELPKVTIRRVSRDANRFYGYDPNSAELVGKDLQYLLERLKPWMVEEDFSAFVSDQTEVGEKLARGELIAARVPIRLNDKHPDLNFRGKQFLPITLGSTIRKTMKFITVVYIDLDMISQVSKPLQNAP